MQTAITMRFIAALLLGTALSVAAGPFLSKFDDDNPTIGKVISAPELRIIMKRTAVTHHQKRSLQASLHPVLSGFNASLNHLFEGTSGEHDHELGKYYALKAHSSHHDNLLELLRRHPAVDHAYVSPSLIIPDAEFSESYKHKLLARAAAAATAASAQTPDLSNTQNALFQSADKGGMDITYAQQQKGGLGDGVQIFQIEFDWLHTHEDLQQNMRYVGSDGPTGPTGSHATGAAGVVGADRNGMGYNGIAPNAMFTARSLFFDDASVKSNNQNLARAFQWCIDNGKAGDVIMTIIVVDMGAGDGISGPVEWWPEYFDVIRRATDKGMIVVTSAGNDGASLDNPAYGDTLRRKKFGDAAAAKYKNPYDIHNPSSGMIVVGAVNPPGDGDLRKQLARSSWSNYGWRLNVATWGRYIKTTTSQPACNVFDGGPNRCYMDYYTGTSASGAVMAGVVASIQGVVMGAGRKPLNAWDFKDLFNDQRGGMDQIDWPAGDSPKSKRVGIQPDLRKMIPLAIAMSKARHG